MNSFLFVEYQILLFSLIVINPWNLVHHERHRQQEKFWVGIKTTKSNVNKHLTICLSTKINLIPAEINETTCILKKNIFLILYLHGISSLSYGDGKYIKKITMFHALVEKQLRYSSHKNLFCLITVNSQINVCIYKCKSKTPCRHATEN